MVTLQGLGYIIDDLSVFQAICKFLGFSKKGNCQAKCHSTMKGRRSITRQQKVADIRILSNIISNAFPAFFSLFASAYIFYHSSRTC